MAFTGGPEASQHVIRNSVENLASTSLEFGGKSPFIVFADADLESAANAQVAGVFAAAGLNCMADSRLIVERRVKDELLALPKQKAERIRIGSPLNMATEVGLLATARQHQHVASLVERPPAAGARIVTGGKLPHGEGFYHPPTILDCDGVNSPSFVNEFFGPVLSVISFETEDEALRLANDTSYGLASVVFTQNLT